MRSSIRRRQQAIEVPVRPDNGSKAIYGQCQKPAPGYDTPAVRRYEFIPFWGFVVILLYARRRVRCPDCVHWSPPSKSVRKLPRIVMAAWCGVYSIPT
ncbi:MAG: hypothetical protein ACKV22_37925 [Bryobacteraceae bacterium]